MELRGKSIRSWCNGSSDRSFMVDPLGYFSFQPVPMTCVPKAVVCAILSVMLLGHVCACGNLINGHSTSTGATSRLSAR